MLGGGCKDIVLKTVGVGKTMKREILKEKDVKTICAEKGIALSLIHI